MYRYLKECFIDKVPNLLLLCRNSQKSELCEKGIRLLRIHVQIVTKKEKVITCYTTKHNFFRVLKLFYLFRALTFHS